MNIPDLIGLASLTVCVICLLALHVLPTGLVPYRDFVSSYALTKYGFLYNVQAVASGLSGASVLFIIRQSDVRFSVLGIISLAAYSLSRIVIPFYAIDRSGTSSPRGRIHNVLAALTFTGISLASIFLAQSMGELSKSSSVAGFLAMVGNITAIASVVFILTMLIRNFRSFSGLIERVIYLGSIVWMGTVLLTVR